MFKVTKKNINQNRKCPICNGLKVKKISEVFIKNKFVFFSTSYCLSCSHIYRDKTPSQSWFIKNYNLRSKFKNKNKQINLKYESFRNQRYKKIFRLLKSFDYENLLDIGCATGEGTKIFKKRKTFLEGLDTDPSRLRYAKKNLDKVYNSDIESFKTKKKYDLILLIHTLEHTFNINKILKKIKNLMKEKTNLYIEVPDFYNTVRNWTDNVYLGHQHVFSAKSLYKILIKNNIYPEKYIKPQTEFGEENIGFICSLKKNILSSNKFKDTFKELTALKNYQLISKKKFSKKRLLRINIDEINDLSITYKIKSLKNTDFFISNNLRYLKFNNDIKKYEIEKKLEKNYLKEKKIKKLLIYKNLKLS